MKGVKFHQSIPKYLLRKARLNSKFALLKYKDDWEKPSLELPRQVLIKTRMTGICGSDLHQILGEMSFFSSILVPPKQKYLPLGHEVVGEIAELNQKNSKFSVEDRVIINPIAHCETIGLSPCEACKKGLWQQCQTMIGKSKGKPENLNIESPAYFRGYGIYGLCEYFTAFENQLYLLPDGLPNQIAVLGEPLAVAIHAVHLSPPLNSDNILIIGCGIIGLMTLLAVKKENPLCKVIMSAKYEYQGKIAAQLGADEVLIGKRGQLLKQALADQFQYDYIAPAIGSSVNYSANGISHIYDSVGTESSVIDGIQLICNGGEIMIIGLGMSFPKKIDWSMIIMKEIHIKGSFLYGLSKQNGKVRDPFTEAILLLEEKASLLGNLVTHTYWIQVYQLALNESMNKSNSEVIKNVIKWE